jgi:hypothetical protein
MPGKKTQAKKMIKAPYLINIVIRMSADQIIKHRSNTLDFNLKLHGQKYEVRKNYLYLKQKGPIGGIYDRIVKGITQEYMIIFLDNEAQAIELTKGKRDPQIVYSVRNARILSQALREMVGRVVADRKNVIFFIIVLVIVTLAVTKYLGYW